MKRIAILIAVVATVSGALLITSFGGAASACRQEKKAIATLKDSSGDRIGQAAFWNDGTCTTRVVVQIGQCCVGSDNPVSAGYHGFHIHTTGKCEADAVDAEGNPSPFFTASTHWNPDNATHADHKGDLPPLLVTSGGLARAVTLSDRFDVKELFDEDGSAVILHQAPDNLAHIPAATSDGAERYHSHAYDTMGPDEDTLKTGDGGSRFACGVVRRPKS